MSHCQYPADSRATPKCGHEVPLKSLHRIHVLIVLTGAYMGVSQKSGVQICIDWSLYGSFPKIRGSDIDAK